MNSEQRFLIKQEIAGLEQRLYDSRDPDSWARNRIRHLNQRLALEKMRGKELLRK